MNKKKCDCGCMNYEDCVYRTTTCTQCEDKLRRYTGEPYGICFHCSELENNRRLRLST